MAKKQIFTEETLRSMGLHKNADGSYSKAKSVQQPREKLTQLTTKEIEDIAKKMTTERKVKTNYSYSKIDNSDVKPYFITETGTLKEICTPNEEFRRISLVLLGEPMPKQSVRSTKTGHHFQPKKYLDREKDYRKQIAEQLPKDFNMFTEEVQIVKMHFIYAPLKGFQKIKGMMERIRSGELIKKTTKPDCDNLCKISFDSMSELVFKDDALICSIDGIRKYYGTGGCLIIEIIGK